jgi:hypothetical protein
MRNLGQHDAKMRVNLWKQINSIYVKIYYLEQKLKALEAKKARLGISILIMVII